VSRVRIVTDSTCDLPAEVRRDLAVEMVPLKVHFGEEVYLDQVTISPEEFYRKLEASSVMPTTSQPSPMDFVNVYEQLAADPETESIVSIHLSSDMSGTYRSAVMAGQMVKDKGIDVAVVDSRMASTMIGAQVVAAARMALAGCSKQEILQMLELAKTEVRVVFIVDTLEYLRRNGRIGRAASLIGGLLKIKPVLTVADGVVTPLEKLRGSSRVLPRMIELVSENAASGDPQVVYILNANCPDRAKELESMLTEAISIESLMHTSIGAVIGTHAGPGTLAVVWHGTNLWPK
jgi:DegV family protein with EDD domain